LDTQLIKAAVGSVIRHAGTVLAGWLLAQGYIDEGMTTEIIGLVTAGGVVAWSLLEKRLAERKIEAARNGD